MQRIKEKLKQIQLPINSGTLGLFISLLAVGYVASAVQSPCLQAQATCAVGGESVFNENIQIKGGTTYAATLDASGITSDRTITIPNASGTILLGGGLGASKVVATDVSGELTTTEIYPLSIGTSGEVLTVDATNSFLEYSSITGVPSLSVSKSVSTDGTGTLTTNDVYPLTLTGDSVAKTDVSGNLTTGTVDLDEISVGAASTNDEIRLGSSGSWESFTPSGGGVYTLIDSGNLIANSSDSAEVLTCWYGNVLDGTKRYKLIFDGGTGWNVGGSGYRLDYEPIEGDCSTGTKNDWESNSYYQSQGRSEGSYSGNTGPFNYLNVSKCYINLGSNSATNRANNTQGYLSFSAFDNGNGYGLWSEGSSNGILADGSGNVIGQQFSDFGCIVMQNSSYNNPFADITGFQWYFEGGNGVSAPLTRSWALYEISY